MEFISDITLIIDDIDNTDPGILMKILKSYRHEKKGSSYKVTGTSERLDDLLLKLSSMRCHPWSATHGAVYQKDDRGSTQVIPVDVSASIIAYIERKCAKELDKIGGKSFFIEIQPDFRTAHNAVGSTVQVMFKPYDVCKYPVHAEFVRQRFITFYQRTASNLQVTSVPVHPRDFKDLQRRFPQLFFEPSYNKPEVIVTGPFVYIVKLNEFLIQSTGKSPLNKGPAETPSNRTPGVSAAHSELADESCPICMEPIVPTEKVTLQCKHVFCKSCLTKALQYKPVCPTCGKVYGTLTGSQPEGGKMNVYTDTSALPGYEQYGTIVIHYYIPSGIQKEEHPNPGQPYEGASRTAYLPDSSEGKSILKLLTQAFDQRLTFTVGQSTSSGRTNVVTWNDIHHKTSTHGGPTRYGYPDCGYLSRVRDELAVKGVK